MRALPEVARDWSEDRFLSEGDLPRAGRPVPSRPVDGQAAGRTRYRVRYQAYHRGKALLLNQFSRQVPGTIRNADGSLHEFVAQADQFNGDYMKGSHILEAGNVERFILVWTENGFPAHAEVKISNLPRDDEGLLKRP